MFNPHALIIRNTKSEYRNPKQIENSNFKNHKISPSPSMGEGQGEGERNQAPPPHHPLPLGEGYFELLQFQSFLFRTFVLVSYFEFRLPAPPSVGTGAGRQMLRIYSFNASRYFEIRSSAPMGMKWTPWQRSFSPFTRSLIISMLAFSLSGALASFSMM